MATPQTGDQRAARYHLTEVVRLAVTALGGFLSSPSGSGPTALVAANTFVVFCGMSWGPGVWVLLVPETRHEELEDMEGRADLRNLGPRRPRPRGHDRAPAERVMTAFSGIVAGAAHPGLI